MELVESHFNDLSSLVSAPRSSHSGDSNHKVLTNLSTILTHALLIQLESGWLAECYSERSVLAGFSTELPPVPRWYCTWDVGSEMGSVSLPIRARKGNKTDSFRKRMKIQSDRQVREVDENAS